MGVKPKILAIYGMSAAGKDTFLNHLSNNFDLNKILLTTSRPPREKEIDGIDYLFKKKKDILRDDNFLWPIDYNNWIYAIARESIKNDKINVGIFNLYWMKKLFEDNDEHFDLMAIEVSASDKDRLMRSLRREKNPNCDEICRRFLADKQDFNDVEFNCAKKEYIEKHPNKIYELPLQGLNFYESFVNWTKERINNE